MTCPDPQGSYVSPDGVEIPMGKSADSGISHSSLLYNEYPCLLFITHFEFLLFYFRCEASLLLSLIFLSL